MTPTLQRGFQLWPIGYWAEYRLQIACSKVLLSELCDLCARELLPNQEILTNIKGRDSTEQLLPADVGAARLDEIFTLRGNFFNPDQHEIDYTRKSVKSPFTFSIFSRFLDFPNNKDIRYKLESVREGALPPEIEFRELGLAAPIEPLLLRMSLSFFKPKLLFVLGLTPAVVQSITLEASQAKLALCIYAERLKNREVSLATLNPLIQKAVGLLGDLLKIDLSADLAQSSIDRRIDI